MKRIVIILSLLALGSWAYADDQAPMPKDDVRMIRDIQSRVLGMPSLATDAPRGEDLLALADLSAAYQSGTVHSEDYDALFALLQRYRDELLKMGLDASELDTEIKNLQIRTDEMQSRLDKLKPVDGLKIDGKVYSAFDDLHLVGDEALSPFNNLAAKPAGQGLRYQLGSNFSDLEMTLTRGPFSGDVDFTAQQTWGSSIFDTGLRRIYLEVRTPIVLQFGNIYVGETPLTLWRNDDEEPFEPEPFSTRREHLEDDMLLAPDKWMVTGARASTKAVLFGSQDLELEDAIAIVANPVGAYNITSSPTIYVDGFGNDYVERYTTYLDAWHAALPFLGHEFVLSENGSLFWDNTDSAPPVAATGTGIPANTNLTVTAMTEMVNSIKATVDAGIFKADLEYAISSYTNPQYVSDPAAAALTGTAFVGSLGIQTEQGQIKVFGGMVSSGFHAAGAQGRTQDGSYEYLGGTGGGAYTGGLWPFPTDNDQVNANGEIGLGTLPANGLYLPTSYATRFNNVLIPPGVISIPATANQNVAPGTENVKAWQYLMQYDIANFLDPYGEATPNRTSFGIKADWKFFGGFLKPIASYEIDNESDDVVVGGANTIDANSVTAPFNMSRLRAGLAFDFKPLWNWPIRGIAGYTYSTSSNGTTDTTGAQYSLATTMLDAGLEWDLASNLGLDAGYEHLDADGINDAFYVPTGGMAIDEIGYGLWWKPIETLRFDLNYSQAFQAFPSIADSSLEVDEGSARLTVTF